VGRQRSPNANGHPRQLAPSVFFLCDADNMLHRRCPYCKEVFIPSRYHPDQVVCSSPACQRRRRTEYHRQKLRNDLTYRVQCRDSQRKWRQGHPNYMRTFREKHGRSSINARPADAVASVERLLQLVKNNVAIDLKRCPAAAWFVCADGAAENTLANAQVIVFEGFIHTAHAT
jgi:hypothetical protein